MAMVISSLCVVLEQSLCFFREAALRKEELVRSCMHDAILSAHKKLKRSDI